MVVHHVGSTIGCLTLRQTRADKTNPHEADSWKTSLHISRVLEIMIQDIMYRWVLFTEPSRFCVVLPRLSDCVVVSKWGVRCELVISVLNEYFFTYQATTVSL